MAVSKPLLVTQVRNKSAPISFLDAGALPRPNDVFDGDLRGNWTLEVRLILLELSHQLPKSRDLALCHCCAELVSVRYLFSSIFTIGKVQYVQGKMV